MCFTAIGKGKGLTVSSNLYSKINPLNNNYQNRSI